MSLGMVSHHGLAEPERYLKNLHSLYLNQPFLSIFSVPSTLLDTADFNKGKTTIPVLWAHRLFGKKLIEVNSSWKE